MRICFLTQYYPPEIGAPQTRLSDLAWRFHYAGHDVSVLTAMPNYPKGEFYHGYGSFFMQEIMDGIKIFRGFIYPTKSIGLIRRLLNYFSFVFSSLLVGIFKLSRQDIIFTESPPLFLGISGYLLSRLKGARLVFNVSDLWPESAVNLGFIRNGLGLKIAQKLESFCYQKSCLVSGQSKEIVSNIKQRFSAVRTYHLSNGTDIDIFSPDRGSVKKRRAFFGNKVEIIAIYAGLHGIAQGLGQIIRAAASLNNIGGLCVAFVGDGPEKEKLTLIKENMNVKVITFYEAVSQKEIPDILASADYAIIPLKHHIPGAVPSKTYEAMASGLPVVMVADGEPAQIVKDANCGIVVNPGDIGNIAAAMRKLATDSGLRKFYAQNGIAAVRKHYDRKTIASSFINYLEEIIGC